MARESITLILFVFIMCLSSLCSSALGGGLFYACSDGTMDLQKFELSKCSNFGIEDVKTVVTGGDSEKKDDENATALTTTEVGDGLIPSQPIDDEAADPNLTFLDYFNKDRQQIAGVGVSAGASNAAECARKCFSDEVAMTNESEKCQGFVSDDSTYCMLYPSIDVGNGEVHSRHSAFRLKERKGGGGAITQFTTERRSTAYTPDGGPVEYGNKHDIRCDGGALSEFKFNKMGDKVNNTYACLKSAVFGGATAKSTQNDASGPYTRTRGRNDMYYMDRHDINCGSNFLSQWKLNQWSRSMRVDFACTSTRTPDESSCEGLSTTVPIGKTKQVSTWAGSHVKCPANKLLTQWKYNGNTIDYTCCPKPA